MAVAFSGFSKPLKRFDTTMSSRRNDADREAGGKTGSAAKRGLQRQDEARVRRLQQAFHAMSPPNVSVAIEARAAFSTLRKVRLSRPPCGSRSELPAISRSMP